MSDDYTFESTDAGASDTYPMEAGQIKKNGFIMIKGHPCKVVNVSTSKTGKHGHAKCHFYGVDIFSGKKMEDLVSASHATSVPFVKKSEYMCIGVDEDGFVSAMDENNEVREDLKLPENMNPEPPNAKELSNKIRELLDESVDFMIVVTAACGIEQIMDVKVMVSTK